MGALKWWYSQEAVAQQHAAECAARIKVEEEEQEGEEQEGEEQEGEEQAGDGQNNGAERDDTPDP